MRARTVGIAAALLGCSMLLPSRCGAQEAAQTDNSGVVTPLLPVLPKDAQDSNTVDWPGLLRGMGRFLAVEHAYRVMTEPGTRAGLKGSFIRNYTRAVGNLHGWADGDEFYVNYIGHPMAGSVAGFLWSAGDGRYRRAEFGRSPEYWKGRLRAAGFMWAYSAQFEIGTFSEASIGGIQAVFPQQGFVDHVVTPVMGLGWMIVEDAVDKYLIERIEGATGNRWIRILARDGLNPARSFANLLRGSIPWQRYTRAGVMSYRPGMSPKPVRKVEPQRPAPVGAAPFELAVTFQPERMYGGGKATTCLGGGATAGFRMSPSWQVAVEVGGCKLMGLGPNLSGDSLTYMVGPRWVRDTGGPWTAHWQFLVGGNKLTAERMYPERKKLLEQLADAKKTAPPMHDEYTDQVETNALAVATAAGVDYKLTRALAIRVAELSYRHSWAAPLWGRNYSESVKLFSGLVLYMGTW